MKRLGFVNKEKCWNFVRKLEEEMKTETWNRKTTKSGRNCIWFGIGVELGFNNYKFEGKKIPKGLRIRGNQLYGSDDWNSILIYKYEKNSELKEHIDRDLFDKKVVIINLSKNLTGFKYGGKINWIKDGEVIEINSKIRHGIIKVTEERFSISFRKVI